MWVFFMWYKIGKLKLINLNEGEKGLKENQYSDVIMIISVMYKYKIIN